MLKVHPTLSKSTETSARPRYFNARFIWPAIFFLLVLLTGIFIFPDYGISTDERIDYLTGRVNARYIAGKLWPGSLSDFPYLADVPVLGDYGDRHYGAFFQLPASVLPHLFGFSDVREVFLFRHFFTFLFFFGSLLAFYKILQQRFKGWQIPLLGSVVLFLSPRIFADAFFNSKDIIFMALMAAGWYTLNNFRRKFTLKWAVMHALVSAAALDTRIMALGLLGVTFLWLAHELFYASSRPERAKIFFSGGTFTFFLILFTVLFWPYLWSDPVGHFLEVFKWLDRDGTVFDVLYWGKAIPFTNLPWHYIPGWLVITTPLVYSCFFLAGLTMAFSSIFRQKLNYFHTEKGKQDATALLLFFLPLVVVIGTKAILYDGWRHLFFIYIPFLYLAVLGFVEVFKKLSGSAVKNWQKGLKYLLAAFTVANLAHTAWLMISMHPYQNVYFSFLPSGYVEKSFDRDYWGLSYREGLEYILKTDSRSEIPVCANFFSGHNSVDILPPHQRKRLKFVAEAEADYFLTEYRWHPQPYAYQNEVYKIEPNGLKIMSVFKLK